VVKPAELAPFTSLRFGELALEAGFPAGVVNVVPGGPEAGDALVRNRGIDKVSFTGGVATARRILATAAQTITPVVLELGGKSGNIVFPDADLDAASRFAGSVFMANAGQGCVLPTRLIVHESIHDELLDNAVATASSLRLGDPLEADTTVGPLISSGHRDRVAAMIDRARSATRGRVVLADAPTGELSDGFYLPPTILDQVDSREEIAQQEVFGPVLCVLTFSDEDEAIALANDTAYGLAGYLHTNDLRRAHRMVRALNAGYISVNGFAALPASAPFGGFGESGVGKEGGRAGLDEFVRVKNVYLAG
jgi:aldehyde dehydrogenase (NAD+)